jgi:hypothetical protein
VVFDEFSGRRLFCGTAFTGTTAAIYRGICRHFLLSSVSLLKSAQPACRHFFVSPGTELPFVKRPDPELCSRSFCAYGRFCRCAFLRRQNRAFLPAEFYMPESCGDKAFRELPGPCLDIRAVSVPALHDGP